MNEIQHNVDILNREEQRELLKMARIAIKNVVHDGVTTSIPEYQSKKFDEKYGAFVTLHIGDQLRGCIGYMQAVKPLWETIIEMAEAAAMRDPRFEPVQAKEIGKLNIEISVLTPMTQLINTKDLVIGVHGLYIEKGYHRGLLLPQVAVEHNWDQTTFLQQTCLKAGLAKDEWQDPNADLYVFSAQIFNDVVS